MINMSPNDYKRPLQILNNKDFKSSIKYGIDDHNDINAKITVNRPLNKFRSLRKQAID